MVDDHDYDFNWYSLDLRLLTWNILVVFWADQFSQSLLQFYNQSNNI
jgi:hypothetical protein